MTVPHWSALSVRDRVRLGKPREGVLKQIKITALTVFVTDIPVRLMRRHGSGDVAGSVKNAILKLDPAGHAAVEWAEKKAK